MVRAEDFYVLSDSGISIPHFNDAVSDALLTDGRLFVQDVMTSLVGRSVAETLSDDPALSSHTLCFSCDEIFCGDLLSASITTS